MYRNRSTRPSIKLLPGTTTLPYWETCSCSHFFLFSFHSTAASRPAFFSISVPTVHKNRKMLPCSIIIFSLCVHLKKVEKVHGTFTHLRWIPTYVANLWIYRECWKRKKIKWAKYQGTSSSPSSATQAKIHTYLVTDTHTRWTSRTNKIMLVGWREREKKRWKCCVLDQPPPPLSSSSSSQVVEK